MRDKLGLLAMVLGTAALRADAVELQQALQQAIKKAEPSVACVLVSRSTAYRKWTERGATEQPGVLGTFPRTRRDDPQADDLRKLDMSHPDYVPEAYGSGIVLEKSGLILTCAHVVRGATKVFVRLPDGVESYADIHALDGRSDLAVLRLNQPLPRDLKPLVIGDGDAVSKGQFVVALANPFAAGFRDGDPSASAGIVSNLRRRAVNLPSEKDRHRLSLHHFATLLQTDARIHLGSSGGALINLDGKLVGVLTAQAALLGVESPGGFALPMTRGVQRIIETLQQGEEVEYGFLGVSFSDEDGKQVRVADVTGKSPASQAGLRRGDYLLAIDGFPVRSSDDVFFRIGTVLAGNTVEVERSSSPRGPGEKVRVTLAKYHVALPWLASKRPRSVAGLRVDHTSVLLRWGAAYLSIPEGVLIREVAPRSPADRAGLQPDKIISHVNNRPVTTPAQFLREMADLRGEVVLTLFRPEAAAERVTLRVD